jgi:hypothetical protein
MMDAIYAVAFLVNGIDRGMAKAVLGPKFYEGQRDLIASGLGFIDNGRINVLPPVRRHILQKCPIWEDLARDLVKAYIQFLDNAVREENDSAALRSIVHAEASNFLKLLPIAVTRMSSETFLNLAMDVLGNYRKHWKEIVPEEEAGKHGGFIVSFSNALEYIGYRGCQDRNLREVVVADYLRLEAERVIADITKWYYDCMIRDLMELGERHEPAQADIHSAVNQIKASMEKAFNNETLRPGASEDGLKHASMVLAAHRQNPTEIERRYFEAIGDREKTKCVSYIESLAPVPPPVAPSES